MGQHAHLLAAEDLASVVSFISDCHKIETPSPADLCALLSRIRGVDFRMVRLGHCRIGQPKSEFVESMRFSKRDMTEGGGCADDGESCCGVEPLAPERPDPAELVCVPKRFARLGEAEDGFVFCQSIPGGQSHAVCLYIEGVDGPLAESQKAVLELVVPHLLQLAHSIEQSSPLLLALTDREREVLRWVGGGKSNWEISRILGITERTVKYHISNLLTKLRISNRAQAAALASMLPRQGRSF